MELLNPNSASGLVLSILASILVALVLYIVRDNKAQQNAFQSRMERHIHDLREELQSALQQLAVLRALVTIYMPENARERLKQQFPEGGVN